MCRAGFRESKEMMLSMGMPTRADEVRQQRLYCLIKEYFSGTIPSESDVAALFHLTWSS